MNDKSDILALRAQTLRTGLSLRDGVMSCKDGKNTSLLNGGRLLETISVNASQQILVQVHVVEGFAQSPLAFWSRQAPLPRGGLDVSAMRIDGRGIDRRL